MNSWPILFHICYTSFPRAWNMLKQIPDISIVNNNPFLIPKIFSWFSPGDVISFRFFLKISPLPSCLCCLQYCLFQFFSFSVFFQDTGFPHLFGEPRLSVHLCIVWHSLFFCRFIIVCILPVLVITDYLWWGGDREDAARRVPGLWTHSFGQWTKALMPTV